MQESLQRISIVLPVYNEQLNVPLVHEALVRVFKEKLPDLDYEILFVNDGSRDESLKVLRELSERDSHVRFISFTRNFGHQAAITAGIHHATGNAIITMDSDLQHPPETIPEMVQAWQAGAKVVYARRRAQATSAFKRVSSEAYYKLLNKVAEVEMPRDVGDFRLIDRVVQGYVKDFREQSLYIRGVVAWLGFDHEIVDYDEPGRQHGTSNYTIGKMVKLAMNGLVSNSSLPLKLSFWLGVFSVLMAGGFFLFIFYMHFIHGTNYQLYKWLIVILLGMSGVQFILIWILGEYVGRVYGDVRQRPKYVVGASNISNS